MLKYAALLLLIFGMATVSVFAQVGTGMGATTPTTGSGGQTSVQANPSLGSGGGAHPIDTARAIYISGKVVMQDGSPVPQNVTIQRVCSGMAKTVAYTDAKGRFNFRWGDGGLVAIDASDAGSGPGRNSSSGGFGSSQSAGGTNTLAADPFGSRMMNCEVRGYLAGYSSSVINLFSRHADDNPNIGMIVLRRLAGVEGSAISVTSMMAPKNAQKANQQGLEALLKDNRRDAAKDFEKAVAIYPKYADAWMNLAKIRLEQQATEPARAALLRAIDADPKLVTPYLELGLLAAKSANWKESGDYLDQAVKLDPVDFPQAWYADAVAHYNLKDYDAAEKSARESVKLDPRHANPRAGYLLGLVLVEKHDYPGAAAELTDYIKLAPDAADVSEVKTQLGQIEKMIELPKQAARQ